MGFNKSMEILLGAQIAALTAVISFIVVWSPEKAASYKMFELLGGVTASILTVFGLWRMKEMTER
jgi:uncharacterized membrane protein